MACLNWQRWDEAMRLNEAMFGGTGGWVVRPEPELEGGDGVRGCKFIVRVVGLSARELSCMWAGQISFSSSAFPFTLVCMQCPKPRGTMTILWGTATQSCFTVMANASGRAMLPISGVI